MPDVLESEVSDLEAMLRSGLAEGGIDPDVTASAVAAAAETQTEVTPAAPQTAATASPPAVPSPQPEVSAPAAPAAPAASPDDDESLLAVAKRLGVDLSSKYSDDQEALRGLLNAHQMVGRRDNDAQLGKLYRQYAPQFQEFLARQAAPQQSQAPAQPAPPPEPEPELPRYKPEWEQLITQDEHGRLTGDPTALREFEQYRNWQRNPQQFLQPVIESRVAKARREAEEAARQAALQVIHQERDKEQSEQFIAANRDWMFHGGQVREGNLTPQGQVFSEAVLHASHVLKMPTQHAVDYAYNYLRGQYGAEMYRRQQAAAAAPPPAPVAPPPVAQPAKPDILGAALREPNVAAASLGPSSQWREGESLEQGLMRNLREAGVLDQLGR